MSTANERRGQRALGGSYPEGLEYMQAGARVLLVGRRLRSLELLGGLLRDRGMTVREQTDTHNIRLLPESSGYDVVVISRGMRRSAVERLVTALKGMNPAVHVVHALTPLMPVIVAQVEQAVLTPEASARIAAEAMFEIANSRVVLILREPAVVEVGLHRLDAVYRAQHIPVYAGDLSRGRHNLPIVRRVGPGERYVVVRADGETSVHPAM